MSPQVLLLTGATGFVGKVVLSELLRRRAELGWSELHLAIRPGKAKDGSPLPPHQRLQELQASPAFQRIPAEAWAGVQALPCDLGAEGLGLEPASRAALIAKLTHVIHVAASVDFWLPVAEAAQANITAALGVLAMAQEAPRLSRMVAVSTAYVSPHPKEPTPIEEALTELPFDPEAVYADILAGRADEAALMKATGHPNTYTLTKAMAEHLLARRRGRVPLTIVRPSVVSASLQHPVPGWIDSSAAFAGGVLMVGLGLAKAFLADPFARVDVVPVDAVAERILRSTYAPLPEGDVPIHYAAVGLERAMPLSVARDETVRYFRARPAGRPPALRFFGNRAQGFDRADLRHRQRPMRMLRTLARLKGDAKAIAKLDKLNKTLQQVNRGFEAFTAAEYDFRVREPLSLPGYDPTSYARLVAHGLWTHLLKRDERFQSLAGKAHDADDASRDHRWVQARAEGKGWVIQAFGYVLRKLMRLTTTGVTFDRPSFEAAVKMIPPGHAVVLAPTHRSYADFLLVPYLLFAHPELGLPMPGIAAAREFRRIPLLGRLLEAAGAFFVDRGQGRAQPELEAAVSRLAREGRPLMVFLEGQRSRSRRQLPPKRGVLRALAATGVPVVGVPISISYERLPEEAAFDAELRGGAKPKMRLGPLGRWLQQAWRGQVQLGRVHLKAGLPVAFQGEEAVVGASRHLIAEQAAHLGVATTHLEAFLASHPELEAQGVGVDFLTEALTQRGRVVFPGEAPPGTLPTLEPTFRQAWWASFTPELKAHWGQHPAVAHLLKHHRHEVEELGAARQDPRWVAVAHALVAPLAEDFRRVARRIGRPGQPLASPSPLAVLAVEPAAHLPHLEDAYAALREAGILEQAQGAWAWGPQAEALSAWHDACALPAPGPVPSLAEARH